MGGHAYWYFTKYQTDIETTLEVLRQREFAAGRYNPVISDIDFPITSDSPTPGSQHSSIEEAMEASEEEGTRSILDVLNISSVSYSDALDASEQNGMDLFCTTFPLSTEELNQLFNTDKPTHNLIEAVLLSSQTYEGTGYEFWGSIDRGTCRHIVIYENDMPTEVFFAGYSFD